MQIQNGKPALLGMDIQDEYDCMLKTIWKFQARSENQWKLIDKTTFWSPSYVSLLVEGIQMSVPETRHSNEFMKGVS